MIEAVIAHVPYHSDHFQPIVRSLRKQQVRPLDSEHRAANGLTNRIAAGQKLLHERLIHHCQVGGATNLAGITVNQGAVLLPHNDNSLANAAVTLNGGSLNPVGDHVYANLISLTTLGGIVNSQGGAMGLSGVISGLGGLTKQGNGIVTLSGVNSYSGITSIEGGTLRMLDIWDSEEQFMAFVQTRIMPAVAQVGLAGQPDVIVTPMHDLFSSVVTHAAAMLRTVAHCRPEPLAAIVPAMPDDRICVVLTGRPYMSAAPIVSMATISAEAPCA